MIEMTVEEFKKAISGKTFKEIQGIGPNWQFVPENTLRINNQPYAFYDVFEKEIEGVKRLLFKTYNQPITNEDILINIRSNKNGLNLGLRTEHSRKWVLDLIEDVKY